jgi:2,6-dihydroxypseudooxynicotine hydrolase
MADALLETAIANWGPRFTANGVDASDYTRITSGIECWDEWCDAWSDAGDEHVVLANEAVAAGHSRTAGEAYALAATYFHFAKFLFVHDRQKATVAHGCAVAALELAAPLLRPVGRRVEVPFEGSSIVGLLRTPDGPGPHPTVLLVAGLDSAKEEFREIERAFLERGMATFAFDGPGQGEGEVFALRPEWEDVGRVVVEHLRGLDEVDGDRIGVWGVSLGGFYAARIASADLGLRAVVTLCGPYDFGAAWDNLNDLTRRAFQVRAHCETLDDARRRAQDLTMVGRTDRITVPMLVIVGVRDRLFSWHDGERLVAEVGGGATLLVLADGNHGGANVVYRHRPQSADWMAERLGVGDH